MADVKRHRGPSIDAMAFDLLADAFLDVTGVLMRIDPDATKELLRLIQERMVASLGGPVPDGDAAAGSARASERAAWKAAVAIRAAEAVLSGEIPVQQHGDDHDCVGGALQARRPGRILRRDGVAGGAHAVRLGDPVRLAS